MRNRADLEFKPAFMTTGLGSMPFPGWEEACKVIFEFVPEAPFWPQLPRRSFKENMYAQFTEGFPGIYLDEKSKRIFVQSSGTFIERLEDFYKKIWSQDLDAFAITESYAKGLHGFLHLLKESQQDHIKVLKGQVTGPISFGLTLTDENKRSILYNEALEDAILKILSFKARWQEKCFHEQMPGMRTLIFFDEPYMASFGSSLFTLSKDRVIEILNESCKDIKGLKGVHCCGNTDWSILMSSQMDVLSLDAYDYGKTLILYPEAIGEFIEDGRYIAWGIVPTDERILEETTESLLKRLETLIQALEQRGIPRERLIDQSFITPSCGVGTLREELATMVFARVKTLSEALRKDYGRLNAQVA